MTDLVVVDTDILIDAGRELNEAIACLNQIERQSLLAISIVTQMEMIIGCRNKTELGSNALVKCYTCNQMASTMLPKGFSDVYSLGFICFQS